MKMLTRHGLTALLALALLSLSTAAFAAPYTGDGVTLTTVIQSQANHSDLKLSYYLQNRLTGEIEYYVSSEETKSKASGGWHKYANKLDASQLAGLDLDWSQMRWAVRLDARAVTRAVVVDYLQVHWKGDIVVVTDGPSGSLAGEASWVVETRAGDVPTAP